MGRDNCHHMAERRHQNLTKHNLRKSLRRAHPQDNVNMSLHGLDYLLEKVHILTLNTDTAILVSQL